MKYPKISLSILTAIVLTLTACSSGHDWYMPSPNMPAEFKTYQEGLITKAESDLKKDSKDLDAQFQVGFSNQQIGEYGKAEKAYLKTLELNANHTPSLNNLADIYEQVEEYDLAAEYIKRLYTLDPMGVETLTDTIRILLKADMPQNAKEALENFARLSQATADEGMKKFISEQFELILNYKANASK